ncbi:MAG: anaerobic sulfatase maturase [Candidatus Zhuqueibacterota bacterium]
MPVIVNGEFIEPVFIREEMNRLRPGYVRLFQDQSPEEQEAQLRDWATENVIERTLIWQEAQKQNIPVTPQQVAEAFQHLVESDGGEEDFFTRRGLTCRDVAQEVEMKLRVDLFLEALTRDVKRPSPDQARKFYLSHLEMFRIPEMVRAAHIVKTVDDTHGEDEALRAIQAIERELRDGRPFGEIADRESDCPGNGGDLGYFTRGEMTPEFEQHVFSLSIGEVSPIFRTVFGFHIARVTDKEVGRPAEFDAVKDTIIHQLYDDARTTLLEQFVDRLKETARIDILPDAPDSAEIFFRQAMKTGSGDASAQPRKRLDSLLIKPAGPDCNMACAYCFYLGKDALFPGVKIHRMSDDVLRETTRQAMARSDGRIHFTWQGGEPTLAGRAFFERAVQYQAEYSRGATAGNGLQTNGILIDSGWAKFLMEHRFLVGLSLDGPEHIHDTYRLTCSGAGTWSRVADSAKRMLDSGVSVNALSVVTDYAAQFPEEIYASHKALGLNYMQFIPCMEADPRDASKPADYSVSPQAYGIFLCALFDLWRADFMDGKPTTSIRHFDSLVYSFAGLPAPACELRATCGEYVVVEHTGDVYSCDFFVEPAWNLGNVQEGRLIDMLNSERQHEFGQIKAKTPDGCAACPWLQHCRGGCPKYRDTAGASYFCASYTMLFNHAHDHLAQLADALKPR